MQCHFGPLCRCWVLVGDAHEVDTPEEAADAEGDPAMAMLFSGRGFMRALVSVARFAGSESDSRAQRSSLVLLRCRRLEAGACSLA